MVVSLVGGLYILRSECLHTRVSRLSTFGLHGAKILLRAVVLELAQRSGSMGFWAPLS